MQYKNILTLFAIFISLSFCGLAQDNWNQIAIVGNSLGTDKLTKTEVRDIYSGDQERWANNNTVIVVIPSSKHAGVSKMCDLLFDKTPDAFKRYWFSLVFQGRATPPIYLDSNDQILNYVKNNVGAIGILVDYQGDIDNQLTILD
ncbi:hypothetical protein N9R81_01195 [Flavobacteriales bacterium]|nr:hypothetical protein [Flavobacteriales bacterium]